MGAVIVQGDLWLCGECMLAAVNGDGPEDPERDREVTEGLERLGAGLSPDFDSESGDGFNDHSINPCACCETHLHGDRHRFVVFGTDAKTEDS